MKKLFVFALLVIFASGCVKRTPLRPVPIPYYFSNVLFLGNSFTLAPPGPTYQWNGNWGMAATVADSDYVHIIAKKLKAPNPQCVINVKNIAGFELDFENYDFDAELKTCLSTKPDLVIVQISEDVAPDFDHEVFNQRYASLINYIKTVDPKATVFAVGSFWSGREDIDAIMKPYSHFIPLSKLGEDMSYYSWGLYPSLDVQLHPSNKGMKAIAGVIWNQVDSLRKTLGYRTN